MADITAGQSASPQQLNLLKVLGPVHVWGLGVGIVLVGEFMGWNYGVGKGGAFGALIACFVSGLLYTCVAMIDSEITSTVAAAGGQYAQAKHNIGPLMAFNVGLFMVLTYTMLNASDIQVAGQLIQIGAMQLGHDIPWQPFTVLCLAVLTLLNYRGVFATLTANFVITAAAFLTIIILFIGVQPWNPTATLLHKDLLTSLPYGWLGVIAALHFGIWYYLGIEGTCQAAEEVRSPGRALPLGTMSGMITLLIAAAITWYVLDGTRSLHRSMMLRASPAVRYSLSFYSLGHCCLPSLRQMAASMTRRVPGSRWGATVIFPSGSARYIPNTARRSARFCS